MPDKQVMLGPKTRSFPKSWKDTLKLPKSTFPPRGPPVVERAQLLKQCTVDLYTRQRANQTGEEFILHDGPPYANGDLHVGHALNKILKDITCRFQLLQQKRVRYVPGWDCHGLPIELKALEQWRKQKISGTITGGEGVEEQTKDPLRIRQLARALAQDTVEKQKAQFKDWGVMADWENPWTTMDRGFEVKQLGVFEQMVSQGLIYRRFKPVYWSPSTRTALAEAELEYRDDHVSSAAFVKFPLHTLGNGLRSKLEGKPDDISCVIWTTLPWTLPADRAIGYNPETDYVIANSPKHGQLLMARSRIQEIGSLCDEQIQVILHVKGVDLVGTTYRDSVWDSKSQIRPFIPAEHVTGESGSGLAHLAPGHGPDDYRVCLKHNISPFAPVDEAGAFDHTACPKDPSLLANKHVMDDGNEAVLQRLAESENLLHKHKYVHKYPYDWRSKKPVILRATEQWFADVGDIQDAAVSSLGNVTFIPPSGKTRLESFIKNRTEWCISRQRAWGVPIPALYHKGTGDALLTGASVQHIISVVKDRGIDAWWSDDEFDPVWTPVKDRESNGQTSFRRGMDTMDVWFDSGTSWTKANRKEGLQQSIADVYLEGSDQHRGWFQSSLLTHTASYRSTKSLPHVEAPFKKLVTHGFTLDQHGRKMSKRDGNIVSPQEIMDGSLLPTVKKKVNGKLTEFKDDMGPDALRLWVATCDFTKDVSISPEVLKTVNSTLAKYRTTFKQLLGIGMLDDYDIYLNQPDFIPSLNHTIAEHHLVKMQTAVLFHYENFDYHKAVAEIARYVNVDLSAFYFETIKDAAYCGSLQERRSAQLILANIREALMAVLAPVTPLLVQEVYNHTPDKMTKLNGSPHCEGVRSIPLDHLSIDEKEAQIFIEILSAIQSVQEQARFEKKMGSSLQCFVTIQLPEQSEQSPLASLLLRHQPDLATTFVVSRTEVVMGDMPPTEADWRYTKQDEVYGEKVIVHVLAPSKQKCVRCWRYIAPLEADREEALCSRCEKVVFEEAEEVS